MTKLTVAALQLAFTEDTDANIRAVGELVREAAGKGAKVVLPPELFEGHYFCRVEDESLFAAAKPTAKHPSVLGMQKLAEELKIWIPTSFFELDGPHHYNSLAMIGHAVSNVVPVVAANRIGTEHGQRFYGHSFICDERGDMLAEFGADETGVLVATLDLAQATKHRAAFGFFRDRRPELYGRLTEDI